MENFMFIRKTAVLIAFLTVLSHLSLSQPGICPPNLQVWTPGSAAFQTSPLVPWGTVEYHYRYIGSRIEVNVDWSTMTFQGRYGLSSEEFKPFLIQTIIENLFGACPWVGTKTFAFVDQVECSVIRSCYLKVHNERHVLCSDDAWPGPDPDLYYYNSEHYYQYKVSQNCGFSCCETVYTVECETQWGTHAYGSPVVRSSVRRPLPGAVCSSQTQQYDCLTGEPVQCQNTCQ